MTKLIIKVIATVIVALIILSTLLIPINGHGTVYTFERFTNLFKGNTVIISGETIREILTTDYIPQITADWETFNGFRDFINGTTNVINKAIGFLGFIGVSTVNLISIAGYYFEKVFT